MNTTAKGKGKVYTDGTPVLTEAMKSTLNAMYKHAQGAQKHLDTIMYLKKTGTSHARRLVMRCERRIFDLTKTIYDLCDELKRPVVGKEAV